MVSGSVAFQTKILILGPCECGKTTIANYLADATEMSEGSYRPTQGVRIVEFESNGLEIGGKKIDAEVELWDCSGDRKYVPDGNLECIPRFKKCWPAIQKDTNGVILVCNPDKTKQIDELEQWYTNFVARAGIDVANVVIFLHQKPGSIADINAVRLPHAMSNIACMITNIEQDGEALKAEFNNFLCNMILGLTDSAADHNTG